MRDEKVLILDKDVDSGQILKEHVNSFGFNKVYLSTNPSILDDLKNPPAFEIIFVDTETVTSHKKGRVLKVGAVPDEALVVVMHREYDEWVGELMQLFRSDHFMKKPFQIQRVREVLALAKDKKQV
ncbi:MAG: hypothetical protein AB1439_07815 [candidate division FCPU426 bacterium]